MSVRFFKLFVALQIMTLAAAAHPVAQGAMEVVVHPDRITVRARVSNQEAFVAEAFGGRAEPKATLEDVWRRHGDYLLAHLQLTADGAALAGAVTNLAPPEKPTPEARITYELKFDIPPEHQRPRAIEVRQNVLNEFIFAPGNPWEATYIVRISRDGLAAQEGLLLTSKQPLTFTCDWNAVGSQTAPHLDRRAMAATFVRHGIAHILTGYDHLLFIAGLILAVANLWDLVKVVSSFTLAHTITLTLAVLDIVRLPSRIVEPMIAASIVFVALQNVLAPAQSRGWTRLAVAFGFGLFHGLGFAGGLLAAMEGMAGAAIITAIAAFSIGVEIGHQVVALPLFGALRITRSACRLNPDPERIPRWASQIASSAICAAGMVYLVAALR